MSAAMFFETPKLVEVTCATMDHFMAFVVLFLRRALGFGLQYRFSAG